MELISLLGSPFFLDKSILINFVYCQLYPSHSNINQSHTIPNSSPTFFTTTGPALHHQAGEGSGAPPPCRRWVPELHHHARDGSDAPTPRRRRVRRSITTPATGPELHPHSGGGVRCSTATPATGPALHHHTSDGSNACCLAANLLAVGVC